MSGPAAVFNVLMHPIKRFAVDQYSQALDAWSLAGNVGRCVTVTSGGARFSLYRTCAVTPLAPGEFPAGGCGARSAVAEVGSVGAARSLRTSSDPLRTPSFR